MGAIGKLATGTAPGRDGPPVVNTHVHLPPNFSAFTTAEDAVGAAADQGASVVGASNFHDQRIYARFGQAARDRGILPLFGLELISLDEALQDAAIRVNDPGNPGRVYLCGKGIDPQEEPTALARSLQERARAADEARAREMVIRLRDHLATAGLATSLDDVAIAEDVADRAGVPRSWVVLQERHVAMAFQEALFLQVPPERRRILLARAFGGPPTAAVENAAAVQGEIRSRLLKAGTPAFVPESPVAFADAYRLVLERGGIPCYPTLADGADPICQWEASPEALAGQLLERGIFAAELIPGRNGYDVVGAYVAAFRAAGIVVMAGTEHNTPDRIPVEPRCRGGELPSKQARDVFWEGTCVVAAHQHERAAGRPGFVDGQGRPAPAFPDTEARIRWFAELGATLIASAAAR